MTSKVEYEEVNGTVLIDVGTSIIFRRLMRREFTTKYHRCLINKFKREKNHTIEQNTNM